MTRLFRATRVAPSLVALALLAACSDMSTGPAAAGTAEPASSAQSATGVVTSSEAPTSANRPSLAVATTTPSTTTTGTTAVVGCTGTTIVLTADEKRSFDLHNQQRRTSGLPLFCLHPALTAAARAHSQDMMAKGYFSHTSLNGDTFVTRVVRAGYTGWRALAENIAWGSGPYATPESIFQGWMNSAGHKANIMNANLREIGVGVAAETFKTYAGAKMYTADFGTRF